MNGRSKHGSGTERRRSRLRLVSTVAALALVVAIVGVALGAGGAAAGDDVAVLGFDPDEVSVEPGETADVDVTLRSHGDPFGSGVGTIELRLDYPSEYLTVTHIEPGDWFDDAPDGDQVGEGQSDTEVRERVEYANENGAVLFEQSLANPEFGVIGAARVATVTVEVSENVEPATVQLTAEETGVYPVRSQTSQPTPGLPAEFHVDGGGDVVEPALVDDPFADTESVDPSDDDGEATGGGETDDSEAGSDDADTDDENETGAGDSNDGTTADSGPPENGADDDVPAPLGAAVLGVILAAFGLRQRERRWPRER